MTNDVNKLLGRTLIRHEVLPYFILLDERPNGATPVQRRIQRGFEVALYGSPVSGELHLDNAYEQLAQTLEDLKAIAEQILPKSTNTSEIEIAPVEDSIDLNPVKHFKAEAVLRIRISHAGALDQPTTIAEEQVLHTLMENLEALQSPSTTS